MSDDVLSEEEAHAAMLAPGPSSKLYLSHEALRAKLTEAEDGKRHLAGEWVLAQKEISAVHAERDKAIAKVVALEAEREAKREYWGNFMRRADEDARRINAEHVQILDWAREAYRWLSIDGRTSVTCRAPDAVKTAPEHPLDGGFINAYSKGQPKSEEG